MSHADDSSDDDVQPFLLEERRVEKLVDDQLVRTLLDFDNAAFRTDEVVVFSSPFVVQDRQAHAGSMLLRTLLCWATTTSVALAASSGSQSAPCVNADRRECQ